MVTETVVVIRSLGKNRYGDPLPGTPEEFELEGCLFAPGPSQESTFASEQVETAGTVYAPPGSDVRPTDKLRIRGVVYEVVGDVQQWGVGAGTVIVLKRYGG